MQASHLQAGRKSEGKILHVELLDQRLYMSDLVDTSKMPFHLFTFPPKPVRDFPFTFTKTKLLSHSFNNNMTYKRKEGGTGSNSLGSSLPLWCWLGAWAAGVTDSSGRNGTSQPASRRIWEDKHPMTNELKQGAVFVVRLDYLRGKLPQRIYGLMTPNKVRVVLFAPIVAPLGQPPGPGHLPGPPQNKSSSA